MADLIQRKILDSIGGKITTYTLWSESNRYQIREETSDFFSLQKYGKWWGAQLPAVIIYFLETQYKHRYSYTYEHSPYKYTRTFYPYEHL
jgi:hypothetical protein